MQERQEITLVMDLVPQEIRKEIPVLERKEGREGGIVSKDSFALNMCS